MNIKTYDAIVIGSGAAGERVTFHPILATNFVQTQIHDFPTIDQWVSGLL